MIATYELPEHLIIELYIQYGIKPKGVNVVPEFTNTNTMKTRYKIEPCNLSDGSCNLFSINNK